MSVRNERRILAVDLLISSYNDNVDVEILSNISSVMLSSCHNNRSTRTPVINTSKGNEIALTVLTSSLIKVQGGGEEENY